MNLRTRGEGVKKSENFADVINGSPLRRMTEEKERTAAGQEESGTTFKKKKIRRFICCLTKTAGNHPEKGISGIIFDICFYSRALLPPINQDDGRGTLETLLIVFR